ncbi:MAG: hypothetical protein FJ297_08090 [Planctomycetes bacterium]|nr:hypothetical protein [Planctomycetota bacterium]
MRSTRTADAELRVVLRDAAPVRIRIPGWAPRDSVRLSIMERDATPRWDGLFLVIPKDEVRPGATIVVRHDLAETRAVEEMPVSRRAYRLTWRGDEVVDCEPKVPIYAGRRQP